MWDARHFHSLFLEAKAMGFVLLVIRHITQLLTYKFRLAAHECVGFYELWPGFDWTGYNVYCCGIEACVRLLSIIIRVLLNLDYKLNRIFKLARHITGLHTLGMTIKNRLTKWIYQLKLTQKIILATRSLAC